MSSLFFLVNDIDAPLSCHALVIPIDDFSDSVKRYCIQLLRLYWRIRFPLRGTLGREQCLILQMAP